MDSDLDQLAEILEAESAVGEELCRNLAAQKNALVAWNISDLLERIEARKPWLDQLGALEARRRRILGQSDGSDETATLRQVIALLPHSSALKTRLAVLRERNQNIFTRLQTGERDIQILMAKLSGYLQEALRPLLVTTPTTYGESGANGRQRPRSALIQSKA
jgi:hypothetical protein